MESNDEVIVINPLELSRATTENTISTILDISRSQSESSDYKEEKDSNINNEIESRVISGDEYRKNKLLKIRDCLGLLRELFFMSRQVIPMEQR